MAVEPPSYAGGRPPQPGRAPQPGPGALAAIGEGLGAMGQALLRHDLQGRDDALRLQGAQDQAHEIEDRAYVASAGAKLSADLAERQGALQTRIAELRSNAAPGAEGHDAAVEQEVEAFSTKFMDGMDERLQPLFVDNVARIGADSRATEARWTIEQRAAASVTNTNNLGDQLGANLYNAVISGSATGETMAQAQTQFDQALARLPLPGNAREELRRAGYRTMNSGAMRGLIASRPAEAVAAIDAGWGTTLFSPEEIAALRHQAVSQQEHVDAQARAAVRDQAETARATADVLIGQVNDGTVLADGDRATLEAEYSRTEGSTDAADIRQHDAAREALARNTVNQRYDNATPDERRAAQTAIEGQQGWRTNPDLVRAHDQLDVLNRRDTAAASDDMLSLFVRQSGPAVARNFHALNLGDPGRAGMGARFALGDLAGQRYGRAAQYFTKPEADQLREQWQRGTATDRTAFIQQVGQYGFHRAALMMRQVLPADQENSYSLALLSNATMPDRASGTAHVREALDGQANPLANAEGVRTQMETAVSRHFGTAIAALPGFAAAGRMEMARDIYAHRARQRNATGFDEQLWLDSYQDAWGRAGEAGGFARGAILSVPGLSAGNEPWMVPRGMTQRDVRSAMIRGVVDNRALAQAAGVDSPMWSGQPMDPHQLLGLTPVLVYDDGDHARYQFRSGSGFVKSRLHAGDNYTLDVRALARGRR